MAMLISRPTLVKALAMPAQRFIFAALRYSNARPMGSFFVWSAKIANPNKWPKLYGGEKGRK